MKRQLSQLLLPILVSILFGCAVMQPLPRPTGKPEVSINTTDTSRIKGALVSRVAAHGYTLAQDTAYSLMFTKPMEGGGALLYQAALGNAYSSTPQMNISFTFAPSGSATRVYAHINASMANAFGRVDQTNMDKGRAAHEIQMLLEQVKAGVEASRR